VKLGTDSPVKTIIAVVLMCGALYFAYRGFAPDSTTAQPAATAATAVPGSAAAQQAALTGDQPTARKVSGRNNATLLTQSIDPRLRLDLLNTAQNTKYEAHGRNIFAKQAEPEIPKADNNPLAEKQPPPPVIDPGPPPPPPINIKFFGFASRPGDPKQVFLLQNGDIFVAKEGDIVNRRYKIVHINPTSIEVEDMLNNNRQSIPLQQA
jgi:hypothetical protein